MSWFGTDRSRFHWVCLVLVGIVLVQPLALPLHEYNLRQDGYTLVHGRTTAVVASDEPVRVTAKEKDFYNVARCGTHFLIQSLQQFRELFAAGLTCVGLLLSLSVVSVSSLFVRKDEFLSEITLRAPPHLPARAV